MLNKGRRKEDLECLGSRDWAAHGALFCPLIRKERGGRRAGGELQTRTKHSLGASLSPPPRHGAQNPGRE